MFEDTPTPRIRCSRERTVHLTGEVAGRSRRLRGTSAEPSFGVETAFGALPRLCSRAAAWGMGVVRARRSHLYHRSRQCPSSARALQSRMVGCHHSEGTCRDRSMATLAGLKFTGAMSMSNQASAARRWSRTNTGSALSGVLGLVATDQLGLGRRCKGRALANSGLLTTAIAVNQYPAAWAGRHSSSTLSAVAVHSIVAGVHRPAEVSVSGMSTTTLNCRSASTVSSVALAWNDRSA